VWAVMGTARNRIADGGDNQPSSAELAALTRLAPTVAIGAALNLLGCQTPFVLSHRTRANGR
jgi:hypothetical protein